MLFTLIAPTKICVAAKSGSKGGKDGRVICVVYSPHAPRSSALSSLPPWPICPSNGIIKRPDQSPGVQTPKACNSFNFLFVVSGCSDWKCWRNFFCPNLFLHSFWAEKQSQLSCSFVLIARKEFLCFNYKKIWGKNFFCPVGALSIAITQAQCFNSAVYSPGPGILPATLTLKQNFQQS